MTDKGKEEEPVVNIDDTVTVESWTGEWVQVLVKRLGESKVYGKTVEGFDVDKGSFTALPISHLIKVAHVQNIAHRRWTVTLPDGEVIQLKSKRAAKDYCEEYGYVFAEEA